MDGGESSDGVDDAAEWDGEEISKRGLGGVVGMGLALPCVIRPAMAWESVGGGCDGDGVIAEMRG